MDQPIESSGDVHQRPLPPAPARTKDDYIALYKRCLRDPTAAAYSSCMYKTLDPVADPLFDC